MEEKKEISKEELFKLQVYEQEANQLAEQTKLMSEEIKELKELGKELENIKTSGEEEIYSEIKKGIYVKSKLKKENLLIEVGSKVFLPKSFEDVQKIIEKEIGKLNEAGSEISTKINEINDELNKIVNKIQKDS